MVSGFLLLFVVLMVVWWCLDFRAGVLGVVFGGDLRVFSVLRFECEVLRLDAVLGGFYVVS